MADCATFEECVRAQELGFDLVGTTLRSYTPETKGVEIPDYRLLKQLTRELSTPVIAEGGIWERDQPGKGVCLWRPRGGGGDCHYQAPGDHPAFCGSHWIPSAGEGKEEPWWKRVRSFWP